MNPTVIPDWLPGQYTAMTDAGGAVLTHVRNSDGALDWEIETYFDGRVRLYYGHPTRESAITHLCALSAAHVAARATEPIPDSCPPKKGHRR